MFSEFCGPTNFLLHIPLKMEKKIKKILSPAYSLKLQKMVLFLSQGLIFIFLMVIFTTSFQHYKRSEKLR